VPIRDVYLDVAPEFCRSRTTHSRSPDYDPIAELRRSLCFDSVERRVFPFEVSYSTDASLALIDTYASHAAIDAVRRHTLYEQLHTAIQDKLGGSVTKPYEAVLVLGRRRA
jgi:hypothetical protein